ncbi:hypothetical protein RRG08_061535 [Elysia crispata]|uniref:Uncharacterized protein n=1 Tax=Elysia crispata TaxID=231223 RepID=A0AAE1E2H2_9GAST|nr:hypothetical protein RRG08_061535 [Elysia crispata]
MTSTVQHGNFFWQTLLVSQGMFHEDLLADSVGCFASSRFPRECFTKIFWQTLLVASHPLGFPGNVSRRSFGRLLCEEGVPLADSHCPLEHSTPLKVKRRGQADRVVELPNLCGKSGGIKPTEPWNCQTSVEKRGCQADRVVELPNLCRKAGMSSRQSRGTAKPL